MRPLTHLHQERADTGTQGQDPRLRLGWRPSLELRPRDLPQGGRAPTRPGSADTGRGGLPWRRFRQIDSWGRIRPD